MSRSNMRASGHWFAAGSSARKDAELSCLKDEYQLLIAGKPEREGRLRDLKFSERIGNIPRKVYWEDESLFESHDNDVLDAMVARSGKGAASAMLHKMEGSWRWIAASLVITVAVVFSGFRWGLPAAAKHIAYALPVSVHETISTGALATMDELITEKSTLSAATKARVEARFEKLVSSIVDEGFKFTLHFRDMRIGGESVPNAFALPSGDIVVTDAFVNLVEHPEELDSVLLHEIGHVLERHGMQRMIQASSITVIAALALGDLSGLGEIAVGLPVFLMQSSYSRKSESSADEFAFQRMTELGMDPKHFATIILRLTDNSETRSIENDDKDIDSKGEYLSSHPDSQRRAKRALEVSRAFNASKN